MRKLGAEIIRVNGNYEKSLKECIEQSNRNGWEIVQDVAWENYEHVPKLTMAGYSVMVKEISEQTDQYITHIFTSGCWWYGLWCNSRSSKIF